jgi:voltage-gated potassium channel
LLVQKTRLAHRRESWLEALTLVRVLQTIVLLALLLAVLAAFLERLVEPKTFTSLGLSFWWAMGTVSTVGYGDVVPTTPAGRVIGAFLILTALSLIPTLTSLAVSALMTKRTREEAKLVRREGQEIRDALRRIEQELARREEP